MSGPGGGVQEAAGGAGAAVERPVCCVCAGPSADMLEVAPGVTTALLLPTAVGALCRPCADLTVQADRLRRHLAALDGRLRQRQVVALYRMLGMEETENLPESVEHSIQGDDRPVDTACRLCSARPDCAADLITHLRRHHCHGLRSVVDVAALGPWSPVDPCRHCGKTRSVLAPVSRLSPSDDVTPVSRLPPSGDVTPVSRLSPSGDVTPLSRLSTSGDVTPVSRLSPSGDVTPVSRVSSSDGVTSVSRVSSSDGVTSVSRVSSSGRGAPVCVISPSRDVIIGDSGGSRTCPLPRGASVGVTARVAAAPAPDQPARPSRAPCPPHLDPETPRWQRARQRHRTAARHACAVCRKRFPTPSKLAVHRLSHEGARPHQCRVCQRRYLSPQKLHVHARSHTGERPFVCHVCGRTFAAAAYLAQHERTHTGARPHECHVCGKRFTQRGTMTKHVRNVHLAADKGAAAISASEAV